MGEVAKDGLEHNVAQLLAVSNPQTWVRILALSFVTR